MNEKNMNQTENVKEDCNLLSLTEMTQIIGGEDTNIVEDEKAADRINR